MKKKIIFYVIWEQILRFLAIDSKREKDKKYYELL